MTMNGDQPPRLRPVYMDQLDGDDFTDLMVMILDILGYDDVHRLKKGPDGGKDITMCQGRDLIYVENKHWRDTSVGRPAVQKVDSAASRAGAKHAFLVATGRFTKQAIEYADQMRGMRVELIDRDKLIGMAEEAGYKLIFNEEGREDEIYFYPESQADVQAELRINLIDQIEKEGNSGFIPSGKYSFYYGSFYRVEFVIKANPFSSRKATGTSPKRYIIIDARRPNAKSKDDPLASIYDGSSEHFDISTPIMDLEVWDNVKARFFEIRYDDFHLTLDEAYTIAFRYAKKVAEERGLPQDYVSVRNIHRFMIPVYSLEVKTDFQYFKIEAAYANGYFAMNYVILDFMDS